MPDFLAHQRYVVDARWSFDTCATLGKPSIYYPKTTAA